MLLQLIFKLNKEIEALKDKVYGSDEPVNERSSVPVLFNKQSGVHHNDFKFEDHHHIISRQDDFDGHEVEDATYTTMSLEDTEKESIKRALERNSGKRKKTADELQISERTLYRKIKEYGLE